MLWHHDGINGLSEALGRLSSTDLICAGKACGLVERVPQDTLLAAIDGTSSEGVCALKTLVERMYGLQLTAKEHIIILVQEMLPPLCNGGNDDWKGLVVSLAQECTQVQIADFYRNLKRN